MPDFTIGKYKKLIIILKNHGFSFQNLSEFLKNPVQKVIILRHDVDLAPYNSLRFAQIQAELGIKGSYYFRAVPESWDAKVILKIAALGHEVGYHYENLTTCNGDIDAAIDDFKFNLEKLRKLTSVSTICMHGSPRSKFDSKDLWKNLNYQNYGIIGEPYFDIDFNKVFYLTDTGRRWDGWKMSLRDKIPQQDEWIKNEMTFHSTNDIVKAVIENRLPDQIMFTFHPQRWTSMPIPWIKELLFQNIKNQIKKLIVKY